VLFITLFQTTVGSYRLRTYSKDVLKSKKYDRLSQQQLGFLLLFYSPNVLAATPKQLHCQVSTWMGDRL